jgi:glycerol-3-phosphate dehydrogenase subunit C
MSHAARVCICAATDRQRRNVVACCALQGLVQGRKPLGAPVSLHHACHARAQNMGFKANEMLKLIPDTRVLPMERCSGHGGTWGAEQQHFETALSVGKPAFKAILKNIAAQPAADSSPSSPDKALHFVASDCPLAQDHLVQGVHLLEHSVRDTTVLEKRHPIELLAMSYGIHPTQQQQ